jgi:progressive ankylosis protein
MLHSAMVAAPHRTPRAILIFWMPLAIQWIMMALEGPFLAAVIARLDDPTFNLAAYGVTFAFAILVESPVIMLMSASTALVEDASSYRRLRAFANHLVVLSTGLLLLLLVPGVYSLVIRSGLGLPADVADLVYGALWILLPWPAAIGYRRFLHGILIRSGRTRRVAYGTAIRLAGMAGTALVLATTGIPGAWVGAGALAAGVVIEAVAAWFMSRDVVGQLLAGPSEGEGGGIDERASHSADRISVEGPAQEPALLREAGAGTGGIRAVGEAARSRPTPVSSPPGELSYRTIVQFYYPLALTSLIGLTTQPILTFFMGRAPAPVESLAVFPVVMALYFLFGTFGLSYQEAAIALVGRQGEYRRELGRFAAGLAAVASGGLGLIAFTPMARVWFEGVSGLEPSLAALAFVPAQIIALGPALSVIMGFQRAILVQARRTRPITVATAIEVCAIALLFPFFAWGMGWMGVTAAMVSLICGRSLGVAFLTWRVGPGPETGG